MTILDRFWSSGKFRPRTHDELTRGEAHPAMISSQVSRAVDMGLLVRRVQPLGRGGVTVYEVTDDGARASGRAA